MQVDGPDVGDMGNVGQNIEIPITFKIDSRTNEYAGGVVYNSVRNDHFAPDLSSEE